MLWLDSAKWMDNYHQGSAVISVHLLYPPFCSFSQWPEWLTHVQSGSHFLLQNPWVNFIYSYSYLPKSGHSNRNARQKALFLCGLYSRRERQALNGYISMSRESCSEGWEEKRKEWGRGEKDEVEDKEDEEQEGGKNQSEWGISELVILQRQWDNGRRRSWLRYHCRKFEIHLW